MRQVRVKGTLGFTEKLHAKLACSHIFGEKQIPTMFFVSDFFSRQLPPTDLSKHLYFIY